MVTPAIITPYCPPSKAGANIGSVAQFEREMMLERQREGIAKAKAEGKYKGCKHGCKLTFVKVCFVRSPVIRTTLYEYVGVSVCFDVSHCNIKSGSEGLLWAGSRLGSKGRFADLSSHNQRGPESARSGSA